MKQVGGVEPVALERQRGAVGVHDLDVRPRQAIGERGRQRRVHLDRGQMSHLRPQDVGGHAGAGPHLEHVIPEGRGAERPRQQFILDEGGPFGTGAQLQVDLVHAGASFMWAWAFRVRERSCRTEPSVPSGPCGRDSGGYRAGARSCGPFGG